ncbi:MAG: phosphatidylglycerophosphatase A [Synergistales bacterium]|nr:phosphatidylglycerophosphatase A [Synergistales bacterium]
MIPIKEKHSWSPRFVLATGFGLGLLPLCPGSFAALIGLGLHLAVMQASMPVMYGVVLAGFLAFSAGTILLNNWAEAYWKEGDSSHFVLDEVAGYLFAALLFPARSLAGALAIFFLFRIFDIIKLPGARYIDRNWHSGWGVLTDDLVSATYAAVVMHILVRYTTLFGV